MEKDYTELNTARNSGKCMMPPPVMHPRDAMLQLIDLLSVVADNAVPIAQSKRTLYNAYLQQGFSEIQALELIKNATGIPGGF